MFDTDMFWDMMSASLLGYFRDPGDRMGQELCVTQLSLTRRCRV